MKRTLLRLLLVAVLPWCVPVHAQPYPAKPIRMVIPYSPGPSTSDILGRLLATKLSSELGQQIIVDNRPGANGMIGAEAVARAAGDGYTILFGATGPNAINVSLYKKIAYDPVRDFAPVSLIAITTSVLVLHPSVPAGSVKELVRLAKPRPGMLKYGSAGIGGVSHLAGELFNTMAGVKLIHVPYRGMGPSVIDLLGGHIDLMFATMPGTIQHIREKRLKAVAVASSRRSGVLPQLPTISESGLAGFEASSFFGMFAPAKTPLEIVGILNSKFSKIVKSRDVHDSFLAHGADPMAIMPEQFSEFVRSEVAKWAKVIRESGATAQ